MGKTIYLIALLLLGRMGIACAQPVSGIDILKEEQKKFIANLKNASNDTAIVYPIARSFEKEVNSFFRSFIIDTTIAVSKKEKAVWSMVYLVKEFGRHMEKQTLDIYDIPGALQSYRTILTALLYNKPWIQMLTPVPPRRMQLLAAAFNQFDEYQVMDDIAVYKRVASAPQFILQYLENNPRFRFADSLLLEAAANDPLKLVSYLKGDKPVIREKVRNSHNIYIQQIASVAQHKNVTELLPFTAQLAKQQITPEEVLQYRTDAANYFQLLVNTLIGLKYSPDSSSIFQKPLRNGIRQKGLAFYANQINDLHDKPDAVRFASVKNLRPEDLYYIMTSCGDELYTSSYLGLYKRLMARFSKSPRDSLFSIVEYDNFHTFMRLAANYNVLTDFLGGMPGETAKAMLKRFINGIERDTDAGLDRAMDIADCFSGLDSAVVIGNMIHTELRANLDRCMAGRKYLGVRLYSILLQVFELTRRERSLGKLWATLGDYESLKRKTLQNANGEIIQVILFYGDEDGIASFNKFTKAYTDTSKWDVLKTPNWISIRSRSDEPVVMYANLPLDIEQELDALAQDSLFAFLQQQSYEPTILVHRGHSYHLEKTLKRLTPSVRLAILGSCGGYNKAISIASMNPDIQVIGSKKTGAGYINDPIIAGINETLISKNDLYWPNVWNTLAARFSKDRSAQSLFNEYLPPSKNIGLFVLKLFMHYNGIADDNLAQAPWGVSYSTY